MPSEIELPAVFQEIGFASLAEQVPGIVINNLPDKLFMVASYDWDATPARAEQLFSHVHHGIAGHQANRQWDTIRWDGQSVDELVNMVPNADGFGVVSEITENMTSAGKGAQAGEFIRQFYTKLFERSGKADPAETNAIGDYWEHMQIQVPGLQYLLNMDNDVFWNNWKNRMSSETEARKNYENVISPYFASGAHEYRNMLVPGYRDGFHRIPEHSWIYILIAMLEQMHLAVRRKAVQFATDMLEGAEWKINRYSSMQGTRFTNPAGVMYRSSLNNTPSEIMYRDALITSLIGEGQMHWGAAGRSTTNIKRWVRSYNGGSAGWRNQWLKDGAQFPVDYNPNDPTHPALSPGDNPNNYTGSGVQIIPPGFGGPGPFGNHDSLAGRYMASMIRAVDADTNVKWPKFTYTVNGQTKNGYYNGTTPMNGSLGNASVSTLNNRNFGQHNILNQARYKLPINWWIGKGRALWCNPVARPSEVNVVTIDEGGKTYEFESVGSGIKVFDLLK